MKTSHTETAYIPWDDHTDWETASAAAVEWVTQRCRDRQSTGVLVTPLKDGARATPSLTRFTQRYAHTTPRSNQRTSTPQRVPVLAYVPYIKELELALKLGNTAAVCAVEAYGFKLDGWAAATGAIDLTTGAATAPFDEDTTKLLERLLFVGNNGWADPPGKRDARRFLAEIDGGIPTERRADTIAGWMVAKGVFESGAMRLHKMIEGKAT